MTVPVAGHPPAIALVGVSPTSPAAELMMDAMVHLGERRLGGDVGVVSRPASDDGAECSDQMVLVGASMASDEGACPSQADVRTLLLNLCLA
jgi:hypothetical protein